MRTDKTTFHFLGPRYWITWMGVGALWLLARLPLGLQVTLGKLTGLFAYYFAISRKDISRINIELCFPELSQKQRDKLLRDTFISSGIGVVEVARSWFGNLEDYRQYIETKGLDNVKKAQAQGQGVLLISVHYTTLELSAAMSTLYMDADCTYRPHKNPLFDRIMSNARKRRFQQVIDRLQVREAVKSLKDGHVLWYLPDQDYGPKHSVFVPFFGVQAATITATARFARINRSPVIFYYFHREPDNKRYVMEFSPPLENFPSGNESEDACRVNGMIESAIRRHPEQYMWMHRRFKTQAAGKSARPYKK